MWAGNQDDAPCVHDSDEKRAFLSHVDVFHLQRGNWEQQTTSGTPPLGMDNYSCVAVDSDLHYFGGYCGHDDCYHNSVHKLSTSSFQWRVLAPTTTEGSEPLEKDNCGMVAFKDGEEDFLFIVGGAGPTLSSHWPWAQYEYNRTNEQHMFSLSTSELINYYPPITLPVRDDVITSRWVELTHCHWTTSSSMLQFHPDTSG